MKEESLLLLSDLQKLINQVVLIDYTIIILGDEKVTVIIWYIVLLHFTAFLLITDGIVIIIKKSRKNKN